MSWARRCWPSLLIALAAAVPLAVFYAVSFEHVPSQLRTLFTAASVAVLVSGIAVLVPFVGGLGRWRAGLVAAAVIATFICAYSSPDPPSVQGALSHLFEVGTSLLLGLAAAAIVFTAIGGAPAPIGTATRVEGGALPALRLQWLLLGVLACTLLAIVYWSQSQTERVYYWDYLVYWRKTDELYRLLSAGTFSAALEFATAQYAQDYTMLPAILPALVSYVRGSADRITYVLAITLVYAVPAYLLVHNLGLRLADRGRAPAQRRWYAGLLSLLTLLIAFPLFLDRVLDLMPDIGGVALVVIALFLADDIIALLVAPAAEPGSAALARLARLSVALGGLLCLMAFFRRWYVFAAVGICAAGLLLVCAEAIADREARRRIVRRLHIPVVLIAFVVLVFMSWLLIDWSAQPGQHNYADLYASYAFDFDADRHQFAIGFGLVPPALALLALLWTGIVTRERRLLCLLIVSAAVSVALFLQVQSPGHHHYYLLMPLFGAGIVALSLCLEVRWGAVAALALAAVLLLGSVSVSRFPTLLRSDHQPFHDLRSWLPDQQAGAEGLLAMARWLQSEEHRSRKFCLIASSTTINQSIFFELWQLAPDIPPFVFAERMVFLGDVDSRDGPPGKALEQCDLVLVAWPPQTHLPEGRQYSVTLPATDLVKQTGIGAAFQRLPQTFALAPGIKVHAFRKLREPSEAEYAQLVERFHRARGDAR